MALFGSFQALVELWPWTGDYYAICFGALDARYRLEVLGRDAEDRMLNTRSRAFSFENKKTSTRMLFSNPLLQLGTRCSAIIGTKSVSLKREIDIPFRNLIPEPLFAMICEFDRFLNVENWPRWGAKTLFCSGPKSGIDSKQGLPVIGLHIAEDRRAGKKALRHRAVGQQNLVTVKEQVEILDTSGPLFYANSGQFQETLGGNEDFFVAITRSKF